jgi:flagellar biosynthesis/type III secretory pathway chaperone
MTLDNHLEELCLNLESQLTLYQRLQLSGAEMKLAIMHHDREAIARNTTEYDRHSLQLESVEEQRLLLTDRIARAINWQQPHITVDAILRRTQGPLNHRLNQARKQLKAIIGEMNTINTANRIMLEQELLTIGKSLELITRAATPATGYQSRGTPQAGPLKRSFINRIA